MSLLATKVICFSVSVKRITHSVLGENTVMLAGTKEKAHCLAHVLLLPFPGRKIVFKKEKEIISERIKAKVGERRESSR